MDNGGELVHEYAARKLTERGLSDLAALMLERARYGRRKYRHALRTNNGRIAAADALEEVLDAIAYVTQEAIERFDVEAAEGPMWTVLFERLAATAEDLRLIWRERVDG